MQLFIIVFYFQMKVVWIIKCVICKPVPGDKKYDFILWEYTIKSY